MDQASESELRERAVSSEPCSTRPNPFDHGESSRKRRRTSLNGVSRSQSVEIIAVKSSHDSQGSSKPLDSHPAREDSDMKIDSDPNTPHTPDRQLDKSQPPSTAVSSKVTINLRNADRPLDTIPSSPLSPESPTPLSLPPQDDDVKVSVEESEVDMAAGEFPVATPRSSSSNASSSPPVEIVDNQLDDDDDLDVSEPEVTLLHSIQATDPVREFPYRQSGEPYHDAISKLTNYITAHDDVAPALQEWIDNYLEYARGLHYFQAASSIQQHRDLWNAFPDLIWSSQSLRASEFMTIDQAWRPQVASFCISFAKLTAYFVEVDSWILRQVATSQENRLRDLISPHFLSALATLTRRDGYSGDDTSRDDISAIIDAFQPFHRSSTGPLAALLKFVQRHIELVPRFPRAVDSLCNICNMFLAVQRETERKLFEPNLSQQVSAHLRARIVQGLRFFDVVSHAFAVVIEKHVTYLSYDNAVQQITYLGDIAEVALQADHPISLKTLIEYQKDHSTIALDLLPEVFAKEWRFKTYRRLIMSGQMQLRVLAVTNLCTELVTCWKKYGEPQHTDVMRYAPVLQFVSDFLLSSGLVAYLLGPTCHPEISSESGNIVGFLAVTKTYTKEHIDRMWQTITTTQDPRIPEALAKAGCRIANLFTYEALLYHCRKMEALPLEIFGPAIREFCEQILRLISTKAASERLLMDATPFAICLRLLRLSSVFGPRSPIAYPEVQAFASDKLTDIIIRAGLDAQGRQEFYMECLKDLEGKSPTTLGSIHAINIVNRTNQLRDLHGLAMHHGLPKLMADELENAMQIGRENGYIPVISGATNAPRKEIIYQIIVNNASTIPADVGLRLWNMLVGKDAACQEDRDMSWKILNSAVKKPRYDNAYLAACFTDFLPVLPPECFCEGALEFVREGILPLVNDPSSILLDDDENPDRGGIEQLWRMILTALPQTIERQAIVTMVSDIYTDSRSIAAFSHHRARKVHLGLVARCLTQLSIAGKKLRAFSEGTTSGDDEPMVIVAPEAQVQEQELVFIRSLAVLREFHRLYKAKAHFAAPDLRSLISKTTGDVEGESAELKFQSFDGDSQTDVKPLNIGKLNTAASLLASLKEATGFDNYRMYYRGQAFVPHEGDICKSLEDLQIQNGLILVKRESDPASSSVRIRPGASPVEIEILSHFGELWEYLSMEDRLAQEVYHFLVKLPVDDQILRAFQTDTVSHNDIFPLGQPFKSLYAIHALRENLTSRRRVTVPLQRLGDQDTAQAAANDYADALARAMSLTVTAISDYEVIRRCASQDLQISLSLTLVDSLAHILKDPLQPGLVANGLGTVLLNRLLQILSLARGAPASETSARLIQLTFQTILDCCSMSREFWVAFKEHEEVSLVIGNLLLNDWRPAVRKLCAKFIGEKIAFIQSPSAVAPSDFREFFWPMVHGLLSIAIHEPYKCEDFFNLLFNTFKIMREAKSPTLDVPSLLRSTSALLLNYTTFEDVTQPDSMDFVAHGLIRMFHAILSYSDNMAEVESSIPSDFTQKLFWKHLFPPWHDHEEGLLRRVILNSHSRALLIQIIFTLVGEDRSRTTNLLSNLDNLLPFGEGEEDEEPYHYNLPPQFERSKATRAPCGYVGLKNLSNTCYLNSLFTQLFMNIDFREFMLNADIQDEAYSQSLLFHTRGVFGHMQDSIQRFVDPQTCVASIKTYDDTTIDIHNQMDVDEFYNLLFDRWEGQLRSAEEKKTFRSFYGGQLVQQVKSKECTHVSERLEPFSAIQCDIKGKTSLQESLQAYCDGEIMEGDNKYKCSECDNHVDAVKRACLKDIPDNLIFHLKRFDFNLRTLQRNKINDYFSFPHKIDMQPYSVDQLKEPSEKASGSSDFFELVGVLVHSGTAESGHYYSYIRERPTSKTGDVWVEFNDDVVTPWDPAHMDGCCFGGHDYRSHFDGNNISIDKSYSAYMLFYQRSSSLEKGREDLIRSGTPCPVRVAMPEELASHIRHENTLLVRRHCLYDPAQIQFVAMVLAHARNLGGGQCSSEHVTEDLAIQVALSHLDQVASRAKDVPDFQNLLGCLTTCCQTCAKCCLAVYEYFKERPEALRMLVQRNIDQVVRQDTGTLLLRALQRIKLTYPERYGIVSDEEAFTDEENFGDGELELERVTVIQGTVSMLQKLWEYFHTQLRSWGETFGLMLGFVSLGRHELAAFVDQGNLKRALWVIMADSSLTLDIQFTRLVNTLQRRLPSRQPNYENVIGLIDTLLGFMLVPFNQRKEFYFSEHADRVADLLRDPDALVPMTRSEFLLLSRDWGRNCANIFLEKLIGINQNMEATESIILRLLQLHPSMDIKVQMTLRANILPQANNHFNTPYLRAALLFARHGTETESIQYVIRHVGDCCKGLQNTEGRSFFDFLRDTFMNVGTDGVMEDFDYDVNIQGLENLSYWVPGLLGYFDSNVSNEVEVFLQENLFCFGTSPTFEDEDGGARRVEAMQQAGRRLGIECLLYLRDYVVGRNMTVSPQAVAGLQRVIEQCKAYYDFKDESEDDMAEDFVKLSQTVLEPLNRLIVEDLEEDASDQDWNGSECSSEQMESLGDISMHAAGE